MKVLLVLASFGMLAAAVPQYPSSNYGAPAQVSSSYGAPAPASSGYPSSNSGGYSSGPQEQRVHKHVYVHVAPPEAPEPKAPRQPRPPQVPEKHYKILFIRAPEPAPYEAPDIPELPPAPEQKTLVYVLLKKPDSTPALSIPTPAPTKPSKPEVYFIRYKTPEAPNGAYGAPNQGAQPLGPGPAAPAPQSSYGAPSRNGY